MVLQISEERNKEKEKQKKEIGKAYGKYAKQFTPRPKYFSNCVKAFISGGLICMAALAVQNRLEAMGLSQKDAGSFVTIGLIMIAQLLTGLGVFDVIAKYAGAGVIVPITGFANSMVRRQSSIRRKVLFWESVPSCSLWQDRYWYAA